MGNMCMKPSSGGRGGGMPSRSTSGDEKAYLDGQILEEPNLRTFSLLELKSATHNFRQGGIIGEGGFGQVFKGWLQNMEPSKNGTCLVAVKKLHSTSLQDVAEWKSEIDFLGRLYHPNLVKLLGHCSEENEFLLVYEFMAKGSLEGHIFRSGCVTLSWELRLKIVTGAARGLAFLNASGLIYRDLKASNILLDADYNAKLSIFGLVKLGPTGTTSHTSTQVMGTRGYAAPEYMETGHLYVNSDVYGFGMVLLEILSGERALDPRRPEGQRILAEWKMPSLTNLRKLPELMDPRFQRQYDSKQAFQVAQLTLNCLADEARDRPSMKEVVETLEQIESMKSQAREARSGGGGGGSSQDRHHGRTGVAHPRLPRGRSGVRTANGHVR